MSAYVLTPLAKTDIFDIWADGLDEGAGERGDSVRCGESGGDDTSEGASEAVGARADDYGNRKSTSMITFMGIGSPWLVAGLKRHCRKHSTAFSSSPFPSCRTILISVGFPSMSTTAERTTVP